MTKFIPDNPSATYKLQFLPRMDAAAAAGIAAVVAAGGTLTGAQKTAIDVAVRAAKAAGIWTKIYRWWPIVGGTAGAHVIDFKTGAAAATNVNSPTHSATGVCSNGTTSYMSTTVTPNALGSTHSIGACLKAAHGGGNRVVMGSNRGDQITRLYPYSDGNIYNYAGGVTYTTAVGVAAGHHAVVRESPTSLKSYFNGSLTNTNTTATTVASSAIPFFLLADNQSGAPTLFTNYNCAQFWCGTTLTGADVATWQGILTTLEAALGR